MLVLVGGREVRPLVALAWLPVVGDVRVAVGVGRGFVLMRRKLVALALLVLGLVLSVLPVRAMELVEGRLDLVLTAQWRATSNEFGCLATLHPGRRESAHGL